MWPSWDHMNITCDLCQASKNAQPLSPLPCKQTSLPITKIAVVGRCSVKLVVALLKQNYDNFVFGVATCATISLHSSLPEAMKMTCLICVARLLQGGAEINCTP